MTNLIEFSIGQQYENRKGAYEVLKIEGDCMRIRWENGEEVDTTLTMQSHIMRRMQYESEQIAQKKFTAPFTESGIPKGWKHRIIR